MSLKNIANMLRYAEAARTDRERDDDQPVRALKGLTRFCLIEQITQEILHWQEKSNDDDVSETATVH